MSLSTLPELGQKWPSRRTIRVERARRKRRSRRRHGPQRRRVNIPSFFDDERYRKARPSGKQKAQKRRIRQADYALTLLPEDLCEFVLRVAELFIAAFPMDPPTRPRLSRMRRAELVTRGRLSAEERSPKHEHEVRRGIHEGTIALNKALDKITFRMAIAA